MKHCHWSIGILVCYSILINTVLPLSLKLIDGKYISVQVGKSLLKLAIDPNSNINFIFHSSYFKFANYNATDSYSLRTSNALLKLAYMPGEFKGNLANDVFNFNFTLNDNNNGGGDDNSNDPSSIREMEFRMNFILVKEAKDLSLPKVDGILGLGYKINQSLFYNQMSLLVQLDIAQLIKKKSIYFNYQLNLLSFEKGAMEIRNQTIVHLLKNDNDTLPIMYYDNIKFGFAMSKSAKFQIEPSLKFNVSLIVDTYEDVNEGDERDDNTPNTPNTRAKHQSFIIAPTVNKSEVYNYYLSKFQRTKQQDQFNEENNQRYMYILNDKFDNINLEAQSAFVFGKFYFVYNWIDTTYNINRIKFPVALGNTTKNFNINLKAFNPGQVSYDYDTLQVRISNCEYCGVTKGEPRFVYIILIFVIVIVGSILLCVGFTKFVRYRKDKASQILKQYNLI